jgi:type IV pilus assembly protein PilC
MLNGISLEDKMFFTKHTAVMLKSGIPLSEAIQTIYDQATSTSFKKILDSIRRDIENGHSLYQALSNHPQQFSALYRNLINIGEQSGKLEETLQYLSVVLRKDFELKKKISSALMYPIIVVVAAIGVGFFISFYVLPKLIVLFESLDVALPLSTRLLLGFAYFMKNYGVLTLIISILALAFLYLLTRIRNVKLQMQRILLKLPFIGAFLRASELTVICRNLGIMLQSGLPIVLSLQTLVDATQNLVYQGYVKKWLQTVTDGKSISVEMTKKEFSNLPKIVAKMVGVGEKSGKLDESFLYLSDFFEDEVDSTTKNLTTALEPILLVGIGILVAFVAFAVISPIYQLTGSIHK